MRAVAAGEPAPRRIDEIQYLRAVAVLLVIVQHAAGSVQSAWLLRLAHWGDFASGVDLFFVISGFVIARVLLPQLQQAAASGQSARVLKQFWIRRIWRIWPAAWLWLGLIFLASTLCDPSVFGTAGANFWAGVAGVGNFANIRFADAFGRYFYGGSFHYWSLSVEEQFYVALPVLALCLGRGLAAFALGFIALQAYYNNDLLDWALRGGGLFFGVLLAVFAQTRLYRAIEPRVLLAHRSWRLVVWLLLLGLLLRGGSPQAGLPSPDSVMATLALVLVWLSSYARGYIFAPARLRPLLLWLGSRSFALYLVHVPVLLAVSGATRAWQTGQAAHSHSLNHALSVAALAAIAGLAELTHRLVERPLRDYGARLAARPTPAGPAHDGARNPDIEALRAIAIAFVLIQHAPFNLVFNARRLDAVLRWGQFWPGVDLFFVISGFLIARGLLAQFEGSDAPRLAILTRFWRRRAWRLWPAAWLWLGLVVLGSAIWTDPPFLGPLRANAAGALAGVLAVANLRFAAASPFVPYGATYPFWSLSLEEQFYLLLPLAIVLAGRRLPWLIGAAILVQLPLAHGRWFTYLRSDALLWGVLLALWSRSASYGRLEPRWLGRARPLGAVILVACLVTLVRNAGPGDSSPPFAVGIIAAVSAVVVWLASYGRGYIGLPRAWQPVLMWAGSRSYVLYLAHVPVYQCAAALSRWLGAVPLFPLQDNLRSVALAVPMMLAAVEITHRFVERPLRRCGSARGRPGALPPDPHQGAPPWTVDIGGQGGDITRGQRSRV